MPAARSERQVLAGPVVLPHRVRDAVALRRRPDRGIADGETADRPGRDHVAFEQRRGQRQHVADVVESVADRIRGQQRLAVDVERQQVADGVHVLGAVQAMHRGVAGIGRRVRRAIEARFERRRQRGNRRLVGTRRLRRAAWRRCAAS